MKEQKKQKGGCMLFLIAFLIGAVFGGFFAVWLTPYFEEHSVPLIFELVFLVIAYSLHIIIHEGGHLVFGLLTGYRFSSFRIYNIMFLATEEGIKVKRLHISGTGGQCLMTPPEDQKKPKFILYNLGGCFLNLIAAAIFLIITLLTPALPYLYGFSVCMIACGVIAAIMNGIPLVTDDIPNDGYNAYSLAKDPEYVYAFWRQLEINKAVSDGKRPSEMPREWFEMPSDDEMKNPLLAPFGVFRANLLLSEYKFDEAKELIIKLLEMDTAMAGIHKKLLYCDLIFIRLLDGEIDEAKALLTKNQSAFMRTMKSFPSVLRTYYAISLSGLDEKRSPEYYEKAFEKAAKSYPYKADSDAERELMELAEEKISAGFAN